MSDPAPSGAGAAPDPRLPVIGPVMGPVIVSVIVPVYRDGALLSGLLEALAAQVGQGPQAGQAGQPPAFELIVVDNDPDNDLHGDSHGPGLLPPLPPLPFAARVLPCATPGSYAARNAGAAVARGAHLAFTDADCRPAPDWLAAMATALKAHPGAILAGPVVLDPGPAPTPWAIFDTVRGIPQAAFVRRGYGATANLALARGLFARLGGFDAARLSGGDAEFCRRAGRAGVPMRYVAAAAVHHPARASRAALETKARRIKGGQVASGPPLRRLLWTLRSLVPPVREMTAYALSPHPWRWKVTACRVRMRLWAVELAELTRLLILRRPPERR